MLAHGLGIPAVRRKMLARSQGKIAQRQPGAVQNARELQRTRCGWQARAGQDRGKGNGEVQRHGEGLGEGSPSLHIEGGMLGNLHWVDLRGLQVLVLPPLLFGHALPLLVPATVMCAVAVPVAALAVALGQVALAWEPSSGVRSSVPQPSSASGVPYLHRRVSVYLP